MRFTTIDQNLAAALKGAEQAIRKALNSTDPDMRDEILYRLNNDTSPENISRLARQMIQDYKFTINRVAEAMNRKGAPLTAEELSAVYRNSKS